MTEYETKMVEALDVIAEALNNVSNSLDDVAEAISGQDPADQKPIADAIRDAMRVWLTNRQDD